jgi:hypothetical protein
VRGLASEYFALTQGWNMAKINNEKILAKLAKAFSTNKKKKKSAKKDRILTVDGKVYDEMLSLKDAKKMAKQYATCDVKIDIYQKEGTLQVDLPVEVV